MPSTPAKETIMTMYYTKADDRYLATHANGQKEIVSISVLELGSDGIYRTKEEHQEWLKQRALEDK